VPGCLDKGRRSRAVLDGPRCNRLDRSGARAKELQPEESVLQAHELPTGAAAMDGQSVPRGSAKNAPQQMRKKLDDPRLRVAQERIENNKKSKRVIPATTSGVFRGK